MNFQRVNIYISMRFNGGIDVQHEKEQTTWVFWGKIMQRTIIDKSCHQTNREPIIQSHRVKYETKVYLPNIIHRWTRFTWAFAYAHTKGIQQITAYNNFTCSLVFFDEKKDSIIYLWTHLLLVIITYLIILALVTKNY